MADLLDRLKTALSDRYTVERELGAGGMATVYLAQDLKLHRQVALKVLRPDLAAALGPDRFLQEIDIAAKLTHPHILGLHDCGEAGGFLYYVMPYVAGQSLRDKLAHEGELPIAEAVRILRDVVEALTHAHKHNVVHRDIKPDNVMLSEHHALVTDFGVAKAVSEATGRQQLTTEGVALGTPTYMSPEQAAADPHIDHRTDIYAVGVVAYELLTGRPPFMGTTPQMILSAHMTDNPERITKYREAVPPALEQLVQKCLEKKAADRWQTAEELLPQLEALATPSGGNTPVGTVPISAVARSKKIAIVTSAVAVVFAAIVVVMLFPRGSGAFLDPERIVVAAFRNETGDPSLDQLGSRAGHWITQGLQQAAIRVAPWDMALQSWQYVQTEAEAGRVRDPIRALAEETGAGTVVSGVVYQENDSLELHVNVTDAMRGLPLGAVEPVRGPRESAGEVIAAMQQQVLGFLAITFDERISAQSSSVVQPPTLDAYRAFDEGMVKYYQRDRPGALPFLYRAFDLDTTFVTALIYATLCHNTLGQWSQSDSLVSILERQRDPLSDYDRHWLDYLRARVDGDNPGSLRAIRRAADLVPGSKAVYNWAITAFFVNRPRETVDALLTLDPDRGSMRGYPSYFHLLVDAYSALDEHESALNSAQRYRATFGGNHQTLAHEAYAMAGLGRFEEITALVDEIIALPEEGLQQGNRIRRIAVELRRHGYFDAAQVTVNRALEWYEARLPETKASATWRYPNYGVALYVANRCDEAYDVVRPLSDEFPDNLGYRAFVGMVAACRGDQAEALEVSQWLEELDRPYLRGGNTIFRSAIAAALGDGENAITFWRQAKAEGFSVLLRGDGRWVAFESLRDYEPWQELMRPKG